ncbi:tetratricopeptide repeat protein [Flexithrix dorotheae]|uniref:tetratricopeptide repeat protein n=1 Tax=Flexithrix dorotheae TaxID=70993 RepID=UPI00146B53CF|nr:tetratricopeptide repeat protein [Flexithrix dorotheae]
MEINWVILVTLVILTLSFILDFFYNIIPNNKAIVLSNGCITYNDGQSLKLLWKRKTLVKDISLLNQCLIDKTPNKGIGLFNKIYTNLKTPEIIRAGIFLYNELRHHEKVKILFEDLSKLDELNDQDYGTYGLNYSYEEDHKKALELYDKSLELNSNNFYSTLNRGYTYNLLEKYAEALEDFNKAIALNSNSAYCYSNRGLSKIKLGDEKGGLEDINKAISIDKNESYAYKNLGLYYFEKGMLEKALELLSKAKQLNEKTNGIDELISKVEENLNVGSK